jgi:hypothetical protein
VNWCSNCSVPIAPTRSQCRPDRSSKHIKAVVQYTGSSYLLVLDDPKETSIPLSKQSEKALQDLLGY